MISSVTNKKIKDLKKLTLKKYRNKEDRFLIEGKHLIEEAYKEGLLEEVLLEENNNYKLDIKTEYVKESVLKYLSELDSYPNMIGVSKKPKSEIKGNRILILDNVQDPGNIGTIIRSAVAFNIDTIILGEGCADIYSSKVVRATQGMIFKINIVYCDLKNTIEKLKKENFQIIGTKVTDAKELQTLEKKDKFAIIMGSEGQGVSKELLDMCDKHIYIKMNEKCESLNVAVATSIILYWIGD